jgi:hypothetical protein
VVDLQAAFLQKLFHIPKRQGVPKVPAHRAENQDGFGLPPLEDRRSGCHFRSLQATSPATPGSCNTSNAVPFGGKKKGADSGIDGLIYFKPEGKATEKAIVSVKAAITLTLP